MLKIAIVGLGPWGLTMLERLVTGLHEEGGSRPVHIAVVEPGAAGAGVFALDTPDWLILNTPCGQHSLFPFERTAIEPRYARGFFEWAVGRGYRWVGDSCAVDPGGRPLSPHDFLPRRLMGEYLSWFYDALVDDLPSGVRVERHRSPAVDITAAAGDAHPEHVLLADGTVLAVDHVVVATGHTRNVRTTSAPTTALGDVAAGTSVAVTGMGLIAVDAVTALTLGRGGQYSRRGDRLRYEPSGHEPQIQLHSRSGLPYCAKAVASADPTGTYVPAVATPARLSSLRGPASTRQVDIRTELLPLVFAEMTARFHTQSALARGSALEQARLHQQLAEAWDHGPDAFRSAIDRAETRHGRFDAQAHVFAGGGHFASSDDYQAHVTQRVSDDLDAALVEGSGPSPVKAAYEVLRVLRDGMRSVIEFRGPTLDSYLDFQMNIRNRFHRLVAGPPALRSQQLLALLEARVVTIPYGPYPTLSADDGIVASTQLDRPHQERVDHVLPGYLEEPSIHRSASPLLRALHDAGRLRELHYGDVPVGSVDLTPEQHPVDVDGVAAPRLWVFGALTEGVRYFTHYIPSPRSRVRAVEDAEQCVQTMLS